MRLRPLTPSSHELAEVNALMSRAFPANEIVPLATQFARPGSELLTFEANGVFAGFISLLTVGTITHILFFAVTETLRGQGLGAQVLDALRRRYPSQRLIADLEQPTPDAPNAVQRQRRYDFYARCGYLPTEVRYTWRGEAYVIVSNGGNVTKEEFHHFWASF